MESGSLRHRITIMQPITERDEAGAVKPATWTTFATRWAKVEALQGRELMQAEQTKSAYAFRVTLRSIDGLQQQMRIEWRGHVLEVVSIIADPRNTEVQLMCAEVR